MRNVSNQYIETMANRRDFYAEAEITFADGQTKTVNKKDFWISGNSFTHSAGGSSFPVGMLIAKRITFSLNNEDDQWSEYDFFGAKIQLFTRFKLDDGKTESLNMGEFTVITPEAYGTTVEVTAMDESYKTDIEYSTGLAVPVSAGIALRDSCQTCGITLLTTTFKNDDFIINSIPENITHRQFIGLCAMLAGGNAVLDEYNRLKIITYDLSALSEIGIDGGKFDQLGISEYVTGDTADGGSFAPWDVGYIADGGTFGDRKNIHVLYEVKSGMTVGVDDVVITGVQMQDEDGEMHLYGKEGYVISIENQLVAGKEEEALQRIGEIIVGLRFRPFTAEHIAYPLAEFMDPAFIIDRKQNVYQTVLTDIEFKYFGFTTLKCTADSPLRNSSKFNSEAAKAVIEARNLIKKERTAREQAVEKLAKELANSSGLYMTAQKQPDGSNIYYMHDKPTLEESKIVWKLTAEAFGISTDGGETYPYGFDASGMAILSRIYTIGLDADYIDAGTLMIGGKDHTDMAIIIQDSTGAQIGKWDKDGIFATKGTFSAALESTSGHIGGWTISDSAIYSDLEISETEKYRVYIQSYLPDSGSDTWIYSIQKASGIGYIPIMYIKGDGRIYTPGFDGTLDVKNGLIVNGASLLRQGLTIEDGIILNEASSTNIFLGGITCGAKTAYAYKALSIMGDGAVQYDFDVYGTFYAASGSISSSDKNKKNSIKSLDLDKSSKFIYSLKPVEFKRNNGTSGRFHHGFISQDVKRAMGDDDWGVYCEVEVEQPGQVSKDGIEPFKDTEKEIVCSLRYEEIIPDAVATLQSQNERINMLEEKVEKLEEKIARMEVILGADTENQK